MLLPINRTEREQSRLFYITISINLHAKTHTQTQTQLVTVTKENAAGSARSRNILGHTAGTSGNGKANLF